MSTFRIMMCSALLFTSGATWAQSPGTFQESARIALRKNPLTGSNQKLIEAQERSVLAFNQSRQPKFVTNITKLREYGSPDLNYTDAFVGLSWNIYRGGSDHYRQESMKAAVAAQKARIDSTDILLPDTNGQLASDVFSSFMSLSANSEGIRIVDDANIIIESFRQYLDQDSKSQIETLLADLEQTRRENVADRLKARETFIYLVLEPPAEQIQTVQQLRESLKVPSTASEAIEIGLQKSPSIVALNYDLEAARFKFEADRLQSTRPSIDLSVGRSHQRSISGGQTYNSNTNQIILSMNYSWGVSTATENDSQRLRVNALELKRESEQRKIRNRIESGYTSLKSDEEFMAQYQQRANFEYQSLEAMLKQLSQGQKVKIEIILDKLKAYIDARSNWTHYTMAGCNRRFALQQAIGTLFDNLNITQQDLESIRQHHQK